MEQGAEERAEEDALVQAFVIPARRARLLEFLRDPKRRRRATGSLDHFQHLDPRRIVPVQGASTPDAIEALLRRRGAGDLCHVVSSDPGIDGRRMALGEALRRVVGRGSGTLLSCVPGVLGYFEGEGPEERYLLARSAR